VTLGFLALLYPWTKAFHVIAVVAWMAGMLYLPRLYVYHCEVQPGSAESERFKVMERRLLRQIINPAMIATWLFGIMLVLTPGILDWSAGWWHVKLAAVILLSGFHGMLSRWRRDFLEDRNVKPQRFYRVAPVDGRRLLRLICGFPPQGGDQSPPRFSHQTGPNRPPPDVVGNDTPGFPPLSRIIDRTTSRRPCISPNSRPNPQPTC
jgi:putative membrane protein